MPDGAALAIGLQYMAEVSAACAPNSELALISAVSTRIHYGLHD